MDDASEQEAFDRGREVRTGEVLERNELPALITDGALIGGLTQAEIDVQIATAHRFPRSMTRSLRSIESFATLDPETALSCVFRKPQKIRNPVTGKMEDGFIEGPSARFAEIVLASWGNARVASRQTDATKEDVEATGIFHDLESNVAWAKSVRRPILTSEGRRFPAHLIATTANAAASIALRNAILSGVPKAVWNSGYMKAYRLGKGDGSTLVDRRKAMLAMFLDVGIKEPVVYELLGVAGQADITVDLMHTGAGLLNALKDGDTDLDTLLAERRGASASTERPGLAAAFGPEGGGKAPAGEGRAGKKRAPAADKPKDTSASATDASGGSQGATSSPGPQGDKSSAGAGDEERRAEPTATSGASGTTSDGAPPSGTASTDQKPPTGASTDRVAGAHGASGDGGFDNGRDHPDRTPLVAGDEIQEGVAGPGEVYFLAGEKVLPTGRRPTWRDGLAFSSASPEADDILIYAGHSPEIVKAADPVAEIAKEVDVPLFNSFAERLANADSWLTIKPAIAALRAADGFQEAPKDFQDRALRLAFHRARELGDPVQPSQDVAFYRVYLLTEPATEDADRHFRALVRTKDWAATPEALKELIDEENAAAGVNQ